MPRTRMILKADYVIVGGGSAGCVLANRLSADPRCKVILVEAGKDDRNPLIHVPGALGVMMTYGIANWNYRSAPQTNAGGRRLFFPAGKVLGGSSSVNGMIYSRGSSSDYDAWCKLGNPGWAFDDVLPYFRRAESHFLGETEVHGGRGPIKVSRSTTTAPLAQAWLHAGDQAGFPLRDDLAFSHDEAFGPTDVTAWDGRRCSAADAYLRPIRGRRNLLVLPRTLATRINVADGRATGVECRQRRRDLTLLARHEVIVSAGAVGSPQLLMLSGIGEASHLRDHGVSVKVDLPGVGSNFHDHPHVSVTWHCRQPVTFAEYLSPSAGLRAVGRYLLRRDGPLAHPGQEAQAYVRSRPDLAEPDLQLQFISAAYADHGREVYRWHGFMVAVNHLRPRSRGRVYLQSPDPTQPAILDPAFLQDEGDVDALRHGLIIARQVIGQRAFDAYRGDEARPGPEADDDLTLEKYIRASVETGYHAAGTCKMGTDPDAVVDARLRVHGISGLRIVDASIMPVLPSGNTNIPVIMIGERAADLILEDGKP